MENCTKILFSLFLKLLLAEGNLLLGFSNHTNHILDIECEFRIYAKTSVGNSKSNPYIPVVNQSIPIVPWNNEQSTAIHNQTFLHLLHRLGFHLPEDSGKLFVRIPNFWTIDVLLHIAERLGPIDPGRTHSKKMQKTPPTYTNFGQRHHKYHANISQIKLEF